MDNKGLLFIPDISGFINFVTNTEIGHSRHIIQELLEFELKSSQKINFFSRTNELFNFTLNGLEVSFLFCRAVAIESSTLHRLDKSHGIPILTIIYN